jgi:hypothetical protein
MLFFYEILILASASKLVRLVACPQGILGQGLQTLHPAQLLGLRTRRA